MTKFFGVRTELFVSERTLIRRINRMLARTGHQLLKTRRTRARGKPMSQVPTERERKLGTYFVVRHRLDAGEARIVEKHVNLEKFARAHGVLADYEKLA